jgi:putative two-component system response regulator
MALRDDDWFEPVERILVALRDPDEARRVERWLVAEGHACARSDDPVEALAAGSTNGFSLVIVGDPVGNAGNDGHPLLCAASRKIAVLLLTDLANRSEAVREVELGAAGYVIRPLERADFVRAVSDALERRRFRLLSRRTQELVERQVRLRAEEFLHREREISVRLVHALELRGIETAAHARRVGRASELIAIALGRSVAEAGDLRTAASMHDVGKLGIPDSILVRTVPLIPEEEALVRMHTEIGARILGRSRDPLLRMAERIALHHHEAYDGTGYPHGIAGDDIPIEARIVAVAHAWDEHASAPGSADDALTDLRRGRGSTFDPRVVDATSDLAEELSRVRQAYPDLSAA